MLHLSAKRVLILAAAMTVTALVAPSLASASSWGPIGTTHVLDSTNLELTVDYAAFGLGISCTEVQLHVDVKSAADVSVTNVGFPKDCHGTDLGTGCTVTAKATQLPWTMTAPATNNVLIHGVDIDFRFETRPPPNSGICLPQDTDVIVTGTLRGGVWDPAQHELTFNKLTATGLTAHSELGNNAPVTVSGTFRDTTQTLTLT